MESQIAALEVKVENLESWADKHERDDDRTHKYMNHMSEDILGRMSGIERSAARFEADLAHRAGSDLRSERSIEEIFKRLRVLERMAWIMIGGMGALGTVATFFGWNILKLLGK